MIKRLKHGKFSPQCGLPCYRRSSMFLSQLCFPSALPSAGGGLLYVAQQWLHCTISGNVEWTSTSSLLSARASTSTRSLRSPLSLLLLVSSTTLCCNEQL